MPISHHKANWIPGSDQWPEPSWPLQENGKTWNKERLKQERIQPWKELEAKGVGIHVGEWGPFNNTSCNSPGLDAGSVGIVERSRLGLALWNYRGPFGLPDSGRNDVQYEEFHGRKLERKMLELHQHY